MLNASLHPSPVVIVGAGPYGLSLAAHLRAKGIPFRIFGHAVHNWATQMPRSMRLQSNGFGSNLSTGSRPYTFAQFCRESGRARAEGDLPVTVEDFVAYGCEFARRYVPTLETEEVTAIRSADDVFRITTTSGEQVFATRVVIATGMSLFQTIPAEFRHLPPSRVTDPALHSDFESLSGRDVTVLGCGASSLNTAAQLHEAGARVTLITGGRKLRFRDQDDPLSRPWLQRMLAPSTPLGTGVRCWLACSAPDVLHALPSSLRGLACQKLIEPAGGSALKDRMRDVPVLFGCRIHAIERADGAGDRLRLTLNDGDGKPRQHLTSHLIAGTGYRIELDRLRFLSSEIRDLLRTDEAGAPKLTRAFESSVQGLHMIGPIAAPSFGPLLRFVAGSGFAAERLSLHLQRAWLRERLRASKAQPAPLRASHRDATTFARAQNR